MIACIGRLLAHVTAQRRHAGRMAVALQVMHDRRALLARLARDRRQP